MSPAFLLLLVISTIVASGVAWMIVGLTPATAIGVAGAIVGVLLYIRPLDYVDASAAEPGDHIGGTDVG
ncbi:hypothetical protein KZX46_21360 (plasmid) [Polymorphobacter sp. PAMC 29334]|uniref:hypothetical protein n=1 Tax=Polymorphobacter sp. PAMC 29334 TaxID=2862331 RepID=UPI001C775ACF|nr:hypothetical protein [Polymorphobacter sp. PAMC 29334]QYE37190.1 hypothetical protein KZX46_21360 [Polymorphobacter sp. PAMC 29334]